MSDVLLNSSDTNLKVILSQLKPGEVARIIDDGQVIATLQKADTSDRLYPCKAGSAGGTTHWMADDFDAPLDDFREYME
ncbi:MAG: DUF2281 domain-containing protein [Pirellula sp.]|jgi:hypothetical protein|nr:DUF2281 domain-containing protein [Pirellula sp.]